MLCDQSCSSWFEARIRHCLPRTRLRKRSRRIRAFDRRVHWSHRDGDGREKYDDDGSAGCPPDRTLGLRVQFRLRGWSNDAPEKRMSLPCCLLTAIIAAAVERMGCWSPFPAARQSRLPPAGVVASGHVTALDPPC